MNTESRQLLLRNRVMRQNALRLTPEQRMARMFALQETLFEQLRRSPETFERFWRRNLKKRVVSAGNGITHPT